MIPKRVPNLQDLEENIKKCKKTSQKLQGRLYAWIDSLRDAKGFVPTSNIFLHTAIDTTIQGMKETKKELRKLERVL